MSTHVCQRSFNSALGLILGFCGTIVAGCGGETKRIFVEYTTQPEHVEALANASPTSPVRVCVAKIDVNWRVDDPAAVRNSQESECTWTYSDFCGRTAQGTMQTESSTEIERVRGGQLWANAVRSRIAELLTRQATATGVSLELVDRDRLKTCLDEKDLELADIIQGNHLSERARLLPVDLFIFGTIEGQTVIRTKMETNPALTIAGFSPYGGSIARSLNCPKQRIQRTVTFAGNLAVHETATGRILVSHELIGQTIEDDRAKPWESDRTELDLMPEVDRIRQKLEGEVRLFVGRLLPTSIELLYTVKSSRSKASKAAIQHLALGADEEALALFRAAMNESPGDHRSAFGAGVACERLGRLSEAEGYYRQAVTNSPGKKDKNGDGESQYLAAVQRVRERLANADGKPGKPDVARLAGSR